MNPYPLKLNMMSSYEQELEDEEDPSGLDDDNYHHEDMDEGDN